MEKLNKAEKNIRDYLSKNLTLISSTLSLVETEYYIPEAIGTRGFIDILAKESNGRYVIIEVKKSNQTARQALHELLKYHETLKSRLALKDSEIECIVVSTEWRELLVPFSALTVRTRLALSGYEIGYDNGVINTCSKKEQIILADNRSFSPVHFMGYYVNEKNFLEGLKSFQTILLKKEVSDYVLIFLKSNVPSQEYHWAIYCATLRMNKLQYRSIIAKLASPDLDDEVIEEDTLSDEEIVLTESDICEGLEVKLFHDLEPFPKSDYSGISNPAKFKQYFLEHEAWEVEQIRRFGALEINEVISNEQILKEVAGDHASQRGFLKREVILSSKSDVEELITEVEKCFSGDCPAWENHIKFAIGQMQKEATDSMEDRVQVSILYPSNIIYSLYNTVKKGERFYLPCYEITRQAKSGNSVEVVFGLLEWTEIEVSFVDIFNRYFNGSVVELGLSFSSGGYFQEDRELCKDPGFSYSTYKNVSTQEAHRFSKLLDFEFVKIDRMDRSVANFIGQNSFFIQELLSVVDSFYFEL